VRPDLEPLAVRQALVQGAVKSATGPALSVPNAIAATGQIEEGICRVLERRDPRREAMPSPWPKVKVKVDDRPLPSGNPEQAPASRDPSHDMSRDPNREPNPTY